MASEREIDTQCGDPNTGLCIRNEDLSVQHENFDDIQDLIENSLSIGLEEIIEDELKDYDEGDATNADSAALLVSEDLLLPAETIQAIRNTSSILGAASSTFKSGSLKIASGQLFGDKKKVDGRQLGSEVKGTEYVGDRLRSISRAIGGSGSARDTHVNISECRPNYASQKDHEFPPNYEPHYARILVEMSNAAYCRIHVGKTYSECFCKTIAVEDFTVVKDVRNDKTCAHGYLGFSIERFAVIVAFRGSCHLSNWLQNLKLAKKDLVEFLEGTDMPADAMVHSGFLILYRSIRDELMQGVVDLVINRHGWPSYVMDAIARWRGVAEGGLSLLVTGHSMGAALAMLFAIDVKLSYGLDFVGYTFGGPRVGNRAFADFFNLQVPNFFRIVNDADLVCHLPLRKFGYYHAGTEIWYRSKTPSKRKPDQKTSFIVEPIDIDSEIPTFGCSSDTMSLVSLNVIDHKLYYDRISGRKKLRGEKPSTEPIYVDNMLKVVAESFNEIVTRSRIPVVVLAIRTVFCPVCRASKSRMAKMTQWIRDSQLEDRILVCTIDGVKNDLPDGFSNRGYPRIYIQTKVPSDDPAKGDEPATSVEEWEMKSLDLDPLLELILSRASVVIDPSKRVDLSWSKVAPMTRLNSTTHSGTTL